MGPRIRETASRCKTPRLDWIYTEKGNASIVDPYRAVEIDAMDAREHDERTLTTKLQAKTKKARNCLWTSLKANCCFAGIWRGTACFFSAGY